jgi:hypothetical protein
LYLSRNKPELPSVQEAEGSFLRGSYFSWLTEKGILAMKPAREVKTSWIKLARATKSAFAIAFCLGLLPTLFARIAVVSLKVEDYFQTGKR